MTREQLDKAIGEIMSVIGEDKPASATEAKFQGVALIALALVGEMLGDIKRIADAQESLASEVRQGVLAR